MSKAADAIPARTLARVALLVAVAASVQTLQVFLSTSHLLEVIAPALIAVSSWGFLILVRLGMRRWLAPLMVASMLVATVITILAFGSVRTAASALFVATICGAGIFMKRRALVYTVLICVAALTVLTWMESRGQLGPADFRVGLTVWTTHVSILVVVAIMVFYSRTTVAKALDQARNELQRRVRSEQERDRNLDRLTRIFRNSPNPMLAQSASTGVILDVNPAFERCYGHPRDSVLGRNDAFLWARPAEREMYVKRLMDERAVHQVEAEGLRADGSSFRALVSSETGKDLHDKLVITSVTDLSAHAEAREKLRRSEERFAKAFNFSPMNLAISRLSDGLILEVNRAGALSEGLGVDGVGQRTTQDTDAWLTPAHRQAYIDQLRRDGRVLAYESQMRDRDGRPVDVRLWAVLIDIDGEECILSSTVNVTEEKRREALLLSVAQGMSGETGEAFFTALVRHTAPALGADLVMVGELVAGERIQTLAVFGNDEVRPNFSYPLAGAPCKKTLAQPDLHVHDMGLDWAYPDERFRGGAPAQAYVGQSLRDHDGTAIGVLSALWRQPISVTAEMQALMSIFSSRATAELVRLKHEREIQHLTATLEQRVKQRTAELEKLNAELDSFAYSVSHDLKSPLRSIDGFTQLLQEQLEGRLSPDESQLLERVLKSTRRMGSLIADLLALARVSQGQLNVVPTDLSDLAEQVLNAEHARQPTSPLRWRIEPGLVFRCDPRLARIALDNLLGNAVKYSRNRPEPFIEMGRVPSPMGDGSLLFIRDNGVGFNMTYADKLFKPFQRLHGPSDFEGTGIGLATVHRIVERHGGRIEGHGQPGQGAEFRFSFGPPAAAS